MNDRLLYRVRNIGTKHASYGAVVNETPLVLEIAEPDLKTFLTQVKVEDMTIPGHANMGTTQAFQAELPYIIGGTSKRWHLWEARIYRQRLVLNFADRKATNKRSKTTALKCYLEKWPAELKMKIILPDIKRPYYLIEHLSPDERFSMLQVKFNADEAGMINTESYETAPEGRR